MGCIRLRLPHGLSRGRGNSPDFVGRLPELYRINELYRHAAGSGAGSCIWRDVRKRQRSHQLAEIFPDHQRYLVFRRLPIGDYRIA